MRPGDRVLGADGAVAVALQEAGGGGPGHGFPGVEGDAGRIGEAGQVSVTGGGLLQVLGDIPVQEGDGLLPGDGMVRGKELFRDALGDAHVLGPGDGASLK